MDGAPQRVAPDAGVVARLLGIGLSTAEPCALAVNLEIGDRTMGTMIVVLGAGPDLALWGALRATLDAAVTAGGGR